MAKRVAPRIPLAILLLATELIDLLFFVFLFAGIERNNEQIELSYIPWSHGLFMAVVWSALAGLIALLVSKARRVSIVVGLVVFSHWVLDFIGHDPDLPLLLAGSPMVGLGLEWTHTPAGLVVHYAQGSIVEFGLFIVGFLVFWFSLKPLIARNN